MGGPAKKKFKTSRSYDITLKIKDEDYSTDILRIRLSSSLATGYQIVIITIAITPQTILLNQLYGQDPIILKINKLDYDETIKETMEFDLMILKSEFDIPVSDIMLTNNQKDRASFEIITVVREPFQIMSTMVNPMFGATVSNNSWTGARTVKQMIETIIKEKIKPVPKLEYDKDNANQDQILQTCCPPTTLSKAIKYLDYNYGIYNGVSAVFCQYDNTLQIMNLTERIKKDYTIFVEHLTTQTSPEDIKKSISKSNNYFYTYDNLSTNYNGNSKFGVLGKTLKHIVLPSNKLYHIIEQNLNDVCTKYGIISKTKGSSAHVNTSVENRIKYYIDNDGLELSEIFANSKIAKQIADTSRVSFSLSHDLPIEKLIKIGSCVKLQTKTQEHIDIGGKYILFSSDLTWNKLAEWHTSSRVVLIRTNKTI